ncbi:MAG: hypothetical protein ABIP06_09110 [Pyrinomonadaceae bacterium]
MYKTVNLNNYNENIENIVFAESKKQDKKEPGKSEATDKPIPKPPPYWTDPLSYRRFNREGTSNIL